MTSFATKRLAARAIILQWIDKLASGTYPQGVGLLTYTAPTGETCYCAYGLLALVLMEHGLLLAEPANTTQSRAVRYFDAKGNSSPRFIPWTVMEELFGDSQIFLRRADKELSISGINDEGATFPEIADLLRQQLLPRFQAAA